MRGGLDRHSLRRVIDVRGAWVLLGAAVVLPLVSATVLALRARASR
ncbi:MAG: hypothetical protein JO325_11040 [Solirubrobacterales bacterium]|nr:hypothetical protein [Solirubrobacterales bacterium]